MCFRWLEVQIQLVILKIIIRIDILSIFQETDLKRMPQDLTED